MCVDVRALCCMIKSLIFVPGTLDLPRAQVLQRCYTDPSLYAKHFNKAGQHMGEGFCAKSERHKLMYFHIPKAGSSTSRHAMLDLFDAHDNAHCRPQDNDWAECQKVSIVREPTSRFYAGYDEWFARRLSHKHTIPEEVREVSEGIPEYKAYEKLFLSPELTRRFEAFVNKWDARNAFDDHIRMQTPTLSNWRNGIAYPMNYLGTVSNMNESWSDIGQLVGRPVQASEVQRGRSFPRRFNTSAVADVVRRRICQILALDYCCLNFPLPEVCAHESLEPEDRVMCKWVHRPEVAVHHLNMNSSWFIEPVHHKLSPSL